MRRRMELSFDGLEEMARRLESQGKSVKAAAEEALKETFDIVTPGISAAISVHRETGATAESLINRPEIEWQGDVGSVWIGFDIKNGGLASIFLMYGTKQTPKHGATPKDIALFNSIYGSAIRTRVADAQQKVFFKHLEGV